MTEGADQPKRGRGRPRLPTDEKKRRNMTFRVRDELREAVEDIAKENGRSLSEQVEYYVEKCVRADAFSAYQNGKLQSTSAIYKYVRGLDKDYSNVGADFWESVNAPGGSKDEDEYLSYVMHNAMLKIPAFMYGLIDTALGDDAPPHLKQRFQEQGEKMQSRYALAMAAHAPPVPKVLKQGNVEEMEAELVLRRTERERMLEAELAAAKAALEEAKNNKRDVLFAQIPRKNRLDDEHSVPALRNILSAADNFETAIVALNAANWPLRFADLSPRMRGSLIGLLRSNSSETYDALMAPEGSRRHASDAFRRLRVALLGPSDEDEGPFEDLGDSGE